MAMEYTSTPTGMPGETQQEQERRTQEERRAVIRRLDEARMAVAERTREAARYANRTVYSNPWTSVGVSFATGVVFGLLVGISVIRR
jgi:ElaB/YqjD/DUF883 family membrane-anchored ribosome-binding protein